MSLHATTPTGEHRLDFAEPEVRAAGAAGLSSGLASGPTTGLAAGLAEGADASPGGFELTVVIPMYREAKRIERTLRDVVRTLSRWGRASEVVLVNDGSDDNTLQVVAPFVEAGSRLQGESDGEGARAGGAGQPRVRLVSYSPNRGKGAAVREGLAAARGRWVLVMDADNACRVGEVRKLFGLAQQRPEVGIVAGSRRTADADVRALATRRLTGDLFALALWALGLRLLRDTQCGFKLYQGGLGKLIATHARENGYCFDLEHLLIAKHAGYRVGEVGVAWEHRDGGQVRPIRDGLRMLSQAARLRWRWIVDRPRLDDATGLSASIIELRPQDASERGLGAGDARLVGLDGLADDEQGDPKAADGVGRGTARRAVVSGQ
ncbi:MAG: glycosyltransferase [Planctomycetota bacterium]|nr:glycosyltransferase [Planctomycetota bacterium]